jgi:hypothetical protein
MNGVANKSPCQTAAAFAIVRLPQKRGCLKRDSAVKKRVDEKRETLHNLTSLLLTNTTLRNAQQAVPNKLFKN